MERYSAPAFPNRSPNTRIAATACVGTALEWYDFFIYGSAAALVFNKVFFPAAEPLVGTLLAFATFGVGFLARPLGAVIFGHLGDRVGRRNVLASTLLLMGSATVLIGVLPTYSTIGVWAPILLVILRLIQGIAAGGEMGGAVLIGMEHASQDRKALMGSWAMAGAPGGVFLATAAYVALGGLDQAAFVAWGWRIPFLASVLVVAVGLIIRLRLTESPEFAIVRAEGMTVRLPIAVVLRKYWRQVLLAAGLSAGYNTTTYLLAVFLLSYWTTALGQPRAVILNATLLGSGLLVVCVPAFAALSDRIGRRPVMLSGAIFTALYALALFPLLNTMNSLVAVLAIAIAYVGVSPLYGPMGTYTAELFGIRVRYSGASLGYQLGATLGGGLTPLVATALFAWSGTWAVAIYVAVVAAISIVCLLIARETRPRAVVGTGFPTTATEPVV